MNDFLNTQPPNPFPSQIKPKNLIIFGGTFDPVHEGHLQIANHVQKKFGFDQFVFLPCKIPVLKKASMASPKQRIEMLELVLKTQSSQFVIDTSEINRDTPSYMVDTLTHFRNRYGQDTPITLLLGSDTFLQLTEWYQWRKVLQLANLCVVNRPDTLSSHQWPTAIQSLLSKHETSHYRALLTTANGLIYQYDAGYFPISSTWIRHELAQGRIPVVMPEVLIDYIQDKKIYFMAK